MTNKLFVANLAYSTTDDGLQNYFVQSGNVVSAKVIMDKNTGRSKGFGFVEMGTPEEAQNAMETLNGTEFEGRQIVVKEALPQENRENR